MTLPKAPRFNLRRTPDEDAEQSSPTLPPGIQPVPQAAAPAAAQPPSEPELPAKDDTAPDTPTAKGGPGSDKAAMLFDNHDDGFGDRVFPTASAYKEPRTPAQPSEKISPQDIEIANEEIRKENLTPRQLRTARRLALHHKLPASNEYDAVRVLRAAGIDPFDRGSMLDMIRSQVSKSPEPPNKSVPLGRTISPLPGDGVKLPPAAKPIQVETPEQRAEVNHAAEILRMQHAIVKRRRRKVSLLFLRLFAYVMLPTLIAGWYFSEIATRLYTTKTEFVIQQAENPTSMGGMGGLLQGTGMATSQDSIAVQGYLQSREAMLRLEKDHGFRTYFMGDKIDPLLRLSPDATSEQAYKLYKRYLAISYDPSEGLIRMEVTAPNPEISEVWSKQLIQYAEEQVDRMTQRLREDTMQGARESYEAAAEAVLEAQKQVIALQEKYKVLSSESELALLTQQIGALETQLTQERLSLAQMEANSAPNAARMEPLKRRMATLEGEIFDLRKQLTEGADDKQSLARIQGELLVAQAEVQTRQMILSTSLQAMENARIEANRQVRYLSIAVSPTPPDEPSYPRVFENTAVTMLILLGIYLMIAMTLAILREQVSA